MKPLVNPCPEPAALDRAFCEGPEPALLAHLATCAACEKEWRSLANLSGLLAKTQHPPPLAHSEAVRARLLQNAQAQGLRHLPAPRPWPWLAAAAAVLVCVGLALRWVPFAEPDSAYRATVRPLDAARYAHSREGGDEILRLASGTVLLTVRPLRVGERLRVITADGEVEVRGTVFEVSAQDDLLTAVRVHKGRVEVRPQHEPAVTLQATERWTKKPKLSPNEAPPAPSLVGLSPAPNGAKKALHTPKPTLRLPSRAQPLPPAPAVAVVSQAERSFALGVDDLRAGRFAEAAEAFAQAQNAPPPLSEDAAYWGAIAWARAERRPETIAALRNFRQRFPHSPRRAEVSSILGWQLFDARALDEAERCFRDGLNSPDEKVHRSARDGLSAIATLRR